MNKNTVPNEANLTQDQTLAVKRQFEIARELDAAADQMYGLLILLEHAALNPPEAGPWTETVACGVIELSAATRDRLFAATAAATNCIKPKSA